MESLNLISELCFFVDQYEFLKHRELIGREAETVRILGSNSHFEITNCFLSFDVDSPALLPDLSILMYISSSVVPERDR